MNGQLKVTPGQLKTTSAQFNQKGNSVRNITREMMNAITSLSRVWESEAASEYIRKFRELDDDIQRMVNMIREHTEDLQTMAEAYEAAEDKNKAEASRLSGDVVD